MSGKNKSNSKHLKQETTGRNKDLRKESNNIQDSQIRQKIKYWDSYVECVWGKEPEVDLVDMNGVEY